MKIAPVALAVLLAGATAAFATSKLDTDGDGMVSLDEVKAVHADFPDEDFAQVDIDGDGLLNDDEMALAYGSGILPAEE
ncbi:MAG: hypothetical protein R3D59_06965 [Paracoccaceae bacterium]|nr:hypothetical protein [Maritimibacter sp.]